MIYALSHLIRDHQEDLATLEAWDSGKSYASALEDLEEVISCFEYYAGFAEKIQGEVVHGPPEKLIYVVREPIGVCAQIIPWNYPLGMAAWKLAPALAVCVPPFHHIIVFRIEPEWLTRSSKGGNSIILKPAEQTPLSILYLANLIPEAGFPPGVINIINGYGAEAGSALVAHPGVDKVAFTGSTSTGREIMKLAAGTLKNITLETGGNSL